MSSRLDHRTMVTTYDCDEPGCRASHKTDPGTFKDGWKKAIDEGWSFSPTFEKGISRPRHFCPRHNGGARR